MEYTVISLFAGGGGSSLGYKMAGYKELLAIDFNNNAIETLKANFNFPVWNKDITKIDGKEIMDFCKIKSGELDILDGSPPCQGFSMVGKRNIKDLRNNLYKNYIFILNQLQPKIFVMENVSGMMKGKMRGIFNLIYNELKETNYNIKCKLMNAKYYNVPQSRERLIFIGIRKDYNMESEFPEANKKMISVRQAIKGLTNKTCIWLKPEWETYKMYDDLKIGKNYQESTKSKIGYSFIKVDPNKVCRTITKLEIGNKRYGCHVHWKEKRTMSIEEIKRICSFPDNYILTGNIKEQWAIMMNAVMPNMMYAISKKLKTILNNIYEKENENEKKIRE